MMTEDEMFAEELTGLEGEAKRRMVTHRHREQTLRRARIQAATHNGEGHLICEVPGCGFDFHRTYGELGKGYAHVHHLRPLADYIGTEKTSLEELAIVCANCHAMIHRDSECRALDELISRRRITDEQKKLPIPPSNPRRVRFPQRIKADVGR